MNSLFKKIAFRISLELCETRQQSTVIRPGKSVHDVCDYRLPRRVGIGG